MKVTKILWIIAICLSILSCDKVDDPYIEDVTFEANGRKVLLEDYTGHLCPNCPTAVKTAHMLKDLYGESLILMAVHAGWNARTEGNFPYDFTTPAGDIFDSPAIFNISEGSGNPSGLINRVKNGVKWTHNQGSWGTIIDQQIALPQLAEITITNNYVASSRTLNVSIDSEFLLDTNGVYKISVFIIEDSILQPQANTNSAVGVTPIIMDYVHMHVLRGALNDTWGEQIPSSPVNTIATKNYSYVLNNKLDVDHCHVIAFIYRDDDSDGTKYEIVQAEEKRIIL